MSHIKSIAKALGYVTGVTLASISTYDYFSAAKPTHFRTDDIPAVTVPMSQCVNYNGSTLCYRGMDPTRGIFYINNANFPIKVDADTVRQQLNLWNNNTNLFVLESVAPDSLRIRSVGFDGY